MKEKKCREGKRGLWHDVPKTGCKYEGVVVISDQNGKKMHSPWHNIYHDFFFYFYFFFLFSFLFLPLPHLVSPHLASPLLAFSCLAIVLSGCHISTSPRWVYTTHALFCIQWKRGGPQVFLLTLSSRKLGSAEKKNSGILSGCREIVSCGVWETRDLLS